MKFSIGIITIPTKGGEFYNSQSFKFHLVLSKTDSKNASQNFVLIREEKVFFKNIFKRTFKG